MQILSVLFRSMIEITPLLTTLLSVLIVVIGWWYNQSKNRKNEVDKEARNYRLQMLFLFMNAIRMVEENNNIKQPEPPNEYGVFNHGFGDKSIWIELLYKFRTFATYTEVRYYEEVMEKFNQYVFCSDELYITDSVFYEIYEKLKKLENLCINSIRNELKLK